MPNIATASQNKIEMRFFVRIRGERTPPPTILAPAVKMPLKNQNKKNKFIKVKQKNDK